MSCPVGLVGRTQTVSVIPSATVAAGSGSTAVDQRQQPDDLGGTEVRALPAVKGAITQNPALIRRRAQPSRHFTRTGQTGSREVPSAHKLTAWPYAVTASMPLSI